MSQYRVYILPDEFRAIKRLPGNVRHRIRHAIDHLAKDPRPSQSKQLKAPDCQTLDCEVRRLRIEDWRIVYLITDEDRVIDIVAVRKRPPYDYGDLGQLLGGRSD